MDNETAIKILENEKLCVMAAEFCSRQCSQCCLIKDAKDILTALDMAIAVMKED